MFGPFIKQKPLQGISGLGGGVGSNLISGAPLESGISATGGTTNPYTDPDGVDWTAHKFTSPGTFAVSASTGTGEVQYLVVAVGGGGGGAGGINPAPWDAAGSSGGGGGFRTNVEGHPLAGAEMTVSASPGSYAISVGRAAAGNPAPERSGKATTFN